MAMLQLAEIRPGIVVHLTHRVLDDRGIQLAAQRDDRLGHPFLCLLASRSISTWVMLTSSGRFQKCSIDSECKIGSPWWMETVTYLGGRDAVIQADNWDIQAASDHEKTPVGRRNSVLPILLVSLIERLGLAHLSIASTHTPMPSQDGRREGTVCFPHIIDSATSPKRGPGSPYPLVESLAIPMSMLDGRSASCPSESPDAANAGLSTGR